MINYLCDGLRWDGVREGHQSKSETSPPLSLLLVVFLMGGVADDGREGRARRVRGVADRK